ncbi:hypothetical protein FJT64_010954 [Amphibalanus amphitrite]|uniref:WAP domain-containing protein n=1 Tax=Amphibalanus amphitrite TaxID=1232801 RepID=A0A6A4VB29_AMPAM|nr:hypothetical protein FJT64_010954 [Amphibalanus amphitrite]
MKARSSALLLPLLLVLLTTAVGGFPKHATPEQPLAPAGDPLDDAVVIAPPTNAAECLQAGGECIPADQCPNAENRWNQPFEGICDKEGYECCFKDISQHAAACGVFGGDCVPSERCGAAPRYTRARCARSGEVCCIWLF